MTTDGDAYAIFLNGSYGAGKTSTLDHVGNLLAAANRPFSLIDVDWFHRSWPPATFDQENKLIEARNISAVWCNYQAAGPRQLVLSGVIACQRDVDRYTTAVGLPIRSVRLVAAPQTLEARLRKRYDSASKQELHWHLERCAELQDRQAHADLDEATVHTDARTPAQVARAVIEHLANDLLLL